MLTLDRINAAPATEFVTLLAGAYPNAPWIAQRCVSQRPFATLEAVKHAFVATVRAVPPDDSRPLLDAPGALAAQFDTSLEPGLVVPRGGVDALELEELENKYRERFGFPFVFAPAGPAARGLAYDEVLATIRRRLPRPVAVEFAEALRQIHRHAELWFEDAFNIHPEVGDTVWEWAETLATHRDAGAGQPLTVTYLTTAHQACAAQLQQWMRDCGFDEVRRDAVGNVVGLYRGASPDAKRLLTGSHFDTVRNGGRYDGRLGILAPMAAVRRLSTAHRRLPYAIEVVGFAEEEGQRFPVTFLGSAALTGNFQESWLQATDANNVTLRDAMLQAGLPATMAAIKAERRSMPNYLGFVEVHIEQGPVLSNRDLALAAVTSINGSLRYLGEFTGMASHAGTTPMDQRRDAALAAAELALFVERRARAVPDLVATVGIFEVPGGSINVVPGRCRFSLDIRAPLDAPRDACAAEVVAELEAIARRRGTTYTLQKTMHAPATPCAGAWMTRWEQAIGGLGLPVHRMSSGAGHDAMQLHTVMPQAMLFVRGQNDGISHNPLESITNHDAQLGVDAFSALLEGLALELAP